MLSDEALEKVIEIIVRRIEEGNTYTLEQIGKSLKKIGTLTPSKAQELGQILKYGGDYDKITKKLAQITNKNVRNIKKIFEEVAKKDLNFAKQFYNYRGKKFIPYEQNIALKRQVEAISKIMIDDYISKTNALGIVMKDTKGNVVFRKLNSAYKEAMDRAILSVSQGKSTFDEELYRIIKEMGNSGLKSLVYESGRTMRFDSAIKMQMKDALRTLHNETQMIIGEEFDADGVEISTHLNPADDHEEAQGKQFSKEEYKKLQETGIATSYDNIEIDLHRELKSGETAEGFRPISTYNCYHYIFSIVLGVNKPQYTNQQLKEIRDKNNKGFDFENKHYSMYEGTQLQRQLETEIRKQKDIQIMARASGQDELVQESQHNISILTKKYKELSEASGLPIKKNRMRVSGYRKVALKRIETPKDDILSTSMQDSNSIFISKEIQIKRMNYKKDFIKDKINETKEKINSVMPDTTNRWEIDRLESWNKDLMKYQAEYNSLKVDKLQDKTITLNSKEDCIDLLKEVNIQLDNKNLEKIDLDLLKDNAKQYYELCEKYPFLEQSFQEQKLKLKFEKLRPGIIGEADKGGYNIALDIENYNNKEDAIFWGKSQTSNGFNMPCEEDYYTKYFATHELGHNFDYRVINNVELTQFEDLGAREFYEKTNDYFIDNIFKVAQKNTGKSKNELLELLSSYGKTNRDETMAELFANANCGSPNALGEAFDEYFKELLK